MKCPRFDDTVRYTSVAPGTASFVNLRDGRAYTCSLIFDSSRDSFSCNSVTSGQEVKLISLGLPGGTCDETSFNIGTDNLPGVGANECTYSCVIQP